MRPFIFWSILVEVVAAAGVRGPWGGAWTGGSSGPWSPPSKPNAPWPGTPTSRTPSPGTSTSGTPSPGTPNPGENDFNPLEHLGANSPWFPGKLSPCSRTTSLTFNSGPNVFGISSDAPDGCTVDQAAYVSRHGSRYPDPGAYNGWVALYEKVNLASIPDFRQRLTVSSSKRRISPQDMNSLSSAHGSLF